MRVKVTEANEYNWYQVGEEYDVYELILDHPHGAYYPLEDDRNSGIGVNDCVIVKDKNSQPSEASRLAARIEAANAMAANIPEKTLWDEYAMAALNAILQKAEAGYQDDIGTKTLFAVKYANAMMAARKSK